LFTDDHAWCIDSPKCKNTECYRHSYNILCTDIPHSFMERSSFPECPYNDEVEQKVDDIKVTTRKTKWHELLNHPYDLPEDGVLVLVAVLKPGRKGVSYGLTYEVAQYDHYFAEWSTGRPNKVLAWQEIEPFELDKED
jgi:hypothetical protein